jgi:hypothetical protein
MAQILCKKPVDILYGISTTIHCDVSAKRDSTIANLMKFQKWQVAKIQLIQKLEMAKLSLTISVQIQDFSMK